MPFGGFSLLQSDRLEDNVTGRLRKFNVFWCRRDNAGCFLAAGQDPRLTHVLIGERVPIGGPGQSDKKGQEFYRQVARL